MGEVRCVVVRVEVYGRDGAVGGMEVYGGRGGGVWEEWRRVGVVDCGGRDKVCGGKGGGECGRGGMDVGGGRMRCGWAV